MLSGLVDPSVRPLSIIFERLWQLREAPDDWKRANVTLVSRNGKKENLGNSTGQPHLNDKEVNGDNLPAKHFKRDEGQAGDLQ